MSIRPRYRPQAGADCRAPSAGTGTLLLCTALAVANAACAPSYVHPAYRPMHGIAAYGGTAVLQTSGAAAPALTAQTVNLTICWNPPPEEPADELGWKDMGRMPPIDRPRRPPRLPPVVAFVDVGDSCTLTGTWIDGVVVASPGSPCTLPTAPTRPLRVTDALVNVGARSRSLALVVGRYATVVLPAPVSTAQLALELGGDVVEDDGSKRHVLYTFHGGLVSHADAETRCALSPAPFR
jgi:hypothetical protein